MKVEGRYVRSFTVRSMRSLIERKMFTNNGMRFVWNNWVPLKVNFLAWRVTLDRLPTTMDLRRRIVPVQSVECKFCHAENETATHLFISCSFAQQVWEFIASWCKVNSLFALELKDLVVMQDRCRGSVRWKKAVLSLTQIALWVMWKNRNDVTFSKKHANMARIKEEIRTYGFLWVKNRAKCND
ncbi:uncharacterized protein LOC110943358 [Helianthus annuus]|uniref:uncharacterized protein LOC110943358 n=1 Tax=Helianthus annuus TaxID=4232 RepID=UPI000B904C2E|nr:uncharacterized protein LOC110943358 [Helianthus annuus]